MIKIAIAGISGRMGKMIAQATLNNPNTQLCLGTINLNKISSQLTTMASLLKDDRACGYLSSQLNNDQTDFDVLIDFTNPKLTLENAQFCLKNNKAIVIGTTGLTEKEHKVLHTMSKNIPLLVSPNMSIGVNLCLKTLKSLAETLKNDTVDVEIVDTHHRHKKDAPSGTALAMGQHVADGMSIDLQKNAVYARHGITGERSDKAIGFQSLRAGDVIGDHTVIFALDGERIELSHKASNRNIYANGAIKAAQWLINQKNGLYNMGDILAK